MKLQGIEVLSFDCYGTLIDWETGLWTYLTPLLAGTSISREQGLAAFAEIEPEVEHANPRAPYRTILELTHARLAAAFNRQTTKTLDRNFGASVGDWPEFPDTIDALTKLKSRYKLVILSNVDRQSFAATNKRIGVEFDAICTAEEIGSYKPDLRNFEYLLKTVSALGYQKQQLLHVAQSLFHDHVPAKQLGLANCWIDRRHGQGSGATKQIAELPKYDLKFQNLAQLAAHLIPGT